MMRPGGQGGGPVGVDRTMGEHERTMAGCVGVAVMLLAAPLGPRAGAEELSDDARQPGALEVAAALSIPEKLDALMPELMASFHVPGVSVVDLENRQIAWDRQYGVRSAGGDNQVDRDTVFEACSMSKTPLAYAALKLVERRQLDLDRPLSEYLDEPYLDDEPLHRRITARMALSHTSGFPNWRPGGWRSGRALRVLFEPGSQFGYSGEGFLLVIMTNAVGGEKLWRSVIDRVAPP